MSKFGATMFVWRDAQLGSPDKTGHYLVAGPHVRTPIVAFFRMETGDWSMSIPTDAKEHLVGEALSMACGTDDSCELTGKAAEVFDQMMQEDDDACDVAVYPSFWMQLPEDPMWNGDQDDVYYVAQDRAHRIMDKLERTLINAIIEETRNAT